MVPDSSGPDLNSKESAGDQVKVRAATRARPRERAFDLSKGLGIDFGPEDVQYVLFSLLQAAEKPDSLREKIRLIPLIVDKTLPNTELTRFRAARLLDGLQIIARALSNILTIEDYDVLLEFKRAVHDAFDPITSKTEPPSEADVGRAFDVLNTRLKAIAHRIQDDKSPRIIFAVESLSHLDKVLDLRSELPTSLQIPVADTLHVGRSTRSRSKRRRASRGGRKKP